MSTSPKRIAMWSGPRNISTAMMRSFEARGDAFVTDEPLYAHYLEETGLLHPMAAEIRDHHETDSTKVLGWLTGPVPGDRPVWYQKHMAHHLLPGLDRGWMRELDHAFLIREPGAMIASLENKLGPVRIEDTGLPQQLEIFRRMQSETGVTPPVVDARDVLTAPRKVLSELCARIGLSFEASMLSWQKGRRDTDGIWASHWYDAVEESTGFGAYRQREVRLEGALEDVRRACEPIYAELSEACIRAV